MEMKIDTLHGNVITGDVTFVEPPERQDREMTIWDLSTHELRQYLREEYSTRQRAFLRYWINPPVFGIALLCLCLLAWVWSMVSGGFVARMMSSPNSGYLWLFVLAGLNFFVMMPLGIWLARIRRVEANVAAHAQAEIDAIELVLRRREYANR